MVKCISIPDTSGRHSEFTPQQTMRGKQALYGYLHGIATLSAIPVSSSTEK